jgi:hypothetical protein
MPSGGALGVAILYALSVALFLLVFAFFLNVASQDAANGAASLTFASFFILIYLLALFSGDLNSIGGLITILLLAAFAPALIALAYSIYAGTQPSIVPAPGPPHAATPPAAPPPSAPPPAAA